MCVTFQPSGQCDDPLVVNLPSQDPRIDSPELLAAGQHGEFGVRREHRDQVHEVPPPVSALSLRPDEQHAAAGLDVSGHQQSLDDLLDVLLGNPPERPEPFCPGLVPNTMFLKA
jgi:hypothetical protein